jgi:hypothetical protein
MLKTEGFTVGMLPFALFKVNPKECFLSKNDNLLTLLQIYTLFSFLNFHQSKRARGVEQERGFEKVTNYVCYKMPMV